MPSSYNISFGHNPNPQPPDPEAPQTPWTQFSLSFSGDLSDVSLQNMIDTMEAIKTVPFWNEVSLTKGTSSYTHEVWNPTTEEFEVQE